MSEQTVLTFGQQLANNKRKREKFEEFKETLKQAVDTGQKIEMGKGVIPLILEQLEAMELRYCELVTMHSNNLIIMGAALICLDNKDYEGAEQWLENTTDNCEAHHWQLFDDAQKYYDEIHMPYPLSVENHRENITEHNDKIDALDDKTATTNQ